MTGGREERFSKRVGVQSNRPKSRSDRTSLPAGRQAGMTTEKDDKGFLSFPLVGNLSLEIYNPPFAEWLRKISIYH